MNLRQAPLAGSAGGSLVAFGAVAAVPGQGTGETLAGRLPAALPDTAIETSSAET
jgi:hypothetical protein